MPLFLIAAGFFAGVVLLAALPDSASAAAEREKARLASVREQRAALERAVREKEAAQAAATDQLRAIEKAIAESARKLRALGEETRKARADLAQHERALKRLEAQTAQRKAQLAKLLRQQFPPHDTDALALRLAGENPDDLACERYFLTLLARAQAELINALRADAAQIRAQAELTRQHSAKLAALASSEQAERAVLERRQKERQALLAQLASQIQAQRRTLESLKQDERRLARLLAQLEKKKAAAKRPAEAAQPSQPGPSLQAPPPRGEPIDAAGAFARLRGRLPWPVQGQVAAQFGARRDEGALSWKGMFIRAPEGSEVRAVAAGVVVYADWLRGYGNLLIIDHDDGFLSIYGNNQTLLAEVGRQVGAGKPVATVGNSGGQKESGLYFELRHKGQAFDPGKWLAAR